jgi:plastocyanin
LYFDRGSGAVPKRVVQHYVFVPSTIHARPGEVVTIYNSDQILHRIVADAAAPISPPTLRDDSECPSARRIRRRVVVAPINRPFRP